MNCPHCNVHIDDHPPSRCLRGWVAASVMKWEVINGKDGLPAHVITDKGEHCYLLPDLGPMWFPDFYIAAAWEVVEKLPSKSMVLIDRHWLDEENLSWMADLISMNGERRARVWADTAPLAICRAAIKACLKGESE